MSERLQVRAELVKLSRLLGVDVSDLDYLRELPSSDLREFRERATERLFDEGGRMIGRIGAASRLVPASVSATIAQRAFGPLLCARTAGAVEPARAVAVARRLPTDFLADVVVHLDPRRVVDVIAAAPVDVAEAVAGELGRRGEHVVMGRFLAFVPDRLIITGIGALDDEAMLHTAFVLEHKDRLDHAVGLLPPERLPGLLEAAARLRLWPEVLDLLDHLSEERLGPIADLVATQGDELIADLVTMVSELRLWESLLPVVRRMSGDGRRTMAAKPVFHEHAVLAEVIESAVAQGLWRDLVPLVDALPSEVLPTVAEVAGQLPSDLLDRILHEAVAAPETIDTLVDLLSDLPEPGESRVVAVVDQADRQLAAGLIGAIDRSVDAVALFERLTPAVRDAVRRNARRLGMDAELSAILEAEPG